MIELEYKSKISDPERIESKLLELGAEFEAQYRELDVYYQHPSREFRDEALRLRFLPNPELCYKSPKLESKFKARSELKLGISDPQVLHSILSELGFRVFARLEKLRREYRLGEFRICLDQLENLGWFLELELLVNPTQLGACEHRLEELVRKLGLDPAEGIKKSYLELVLGR